MFTKLINLFKNLGFPLAIKSSDSSYIKGKSSEAVALKYLKQHKWKIIKTNFRCYVGEIDIIGLNPGSKSASQIAYIVAFEIKYRKDKDTLPYAISLNQQRRISRAFSSFLACKPKFNSLSQRFDVIFLNQDYQITHIENAW
ncbi:YraN family protein [Candidatus Hepatincolaceae symbiont of Richtersius coronifer]